MSRKPETSKSVTKRNSQSSDNANPKVDLVTLLSSPTQSSLERTRLDGNETAMIFFTSEGIDCDIHYCREAEIGDYVLCNGDACVLCQVGKKKDRRILLPVYLPASRTIGVLPVSPSLRPQALLPQIGSILNSPKMVACFVSRDGSKFLVSTYELREDMDSGEAVVKEFTQKSDTGAIDLTSVYPRIPNDQLKQVTEIAQLLKLKGIDPSDFG